MEKDNFNRLFLDISRSITSKLSELQGSIETFNNTIKESNKSSNRLSWAIYVLTLAGVVIAFFQYLKNFKSVNNLSSP